MCETTFGHSKVFFWSLLQSKLAFSQILQFPDFENLGGLSYHQDIPKNHEASQGIFFFIRTTFLSHVDPHFTYFKTILALSVSTLDSLATPIYCLFLFLSYVYLCKSFGMKAQNSPFFVLKKRSEKKNPLHGVFLIKRRTCVQNISDINSLNNIDKEDIENRIRINLNI